MQVTSNLFSYSCYYVRLTHLNCAILYCVTSLLLVGIFIKKKLKKWRQVEPETEQHDLRSYPAHFPYVRHFAPSVKTATVSSIHKFCNPDTRDSIVPVNLSDLHFSSVARVVHVRPSWIFTHQKMCYTDLQAFAYANMIIYLFIFNTQPKYGMFA